MTLHFDQFGMVTLVGSVLLVSEYLVLEQELTFMGLSFCRLLGSQTDVVQARGVLVRRHVCLEKPTILID